MVDILSATKPVLLGHVTFAVDNAKLTKQYIFIHNKNTSKIADAENLGRCTVQLHHR